MHDSRVNNRWPVAKEGVPFILAGCAGALLLVGFGLFVLSLVAGALTVFVVFFFRDPDRSFLAPENAVLAPADGRILPVRELQAEESPLGDRTLRVSIFMTLFHVHVNRAPVDGIIKNIEYHPGKFFSANLDEASEQNERNRILIETPGSYRIAVTQVAGLIARRIACWVKEGEHVKAGQRFGLIRFGSRLDVYLPDGSRVTAVPGEGARAGRTVIGYLPEKKA